MITTTKDTQTASKYDLAAERIADEATYTLELQQEAHRELVGQVTAYLTDPEVFILDYRTYEQLIMAQADLRLWTLFVREISENPVGYTISENIEQLTDQLLDGRRSSRSTSTLANAVEDTQHDAVRRHLKVLRQWARRIQQVAAEGV